MEEGKRGGGEEGKKRHDRIVETARRSGMRICGPNTNGLMNVHEGISLGYSYAQEVVVPGRLGYVTQSGALLSATVPRFAKKVKRLARRVLTAHWALYIDSPLSR